MLDLTVLKDRRGPCVLIPCVLLLSALVHVVAHPPHPALNRAEALFNEARDRVFNREQPARTALQEANRLLLGEMRELGLVP